MGENCQAPQVPSSKFVIRPSLGVPDGETLDTTEEATVESVEELATSEIKDETVEAVAGTELVTKVAALDTAEDDATTSEEEEAWLADTVAVEKPLLGSADEVMTLRTVVEYWTDEAGVDAVIADDVDVGGAIPRVPPPPITTGMRASGMQTT